MGLLKPLLEENNIVHSPSVNPFNASLSDSSTETTGQLNNYKLACFLAGQPPPPPPPRNLLHPQQQSPVQPPFPSSLSPYVVPVSSPVDSDICPPDVGRSHIRLVEKLGEGTFGALHLAELDTSSSAILGAGSDFGSQRKLVVLRLIRTHRNGNKTTENNHQEMIREVRRLSVLRDPSIAKVVAVATTLGGPAADGDASTLGVMTEYLEGGPLPVYLRQYRFGATDNFEPGVKTIR